MRRGAGSLGRLVRTNRRAAVAGGILLGFVLIAIFAPVLEPYSTTEQVGPVYGSPSWSHPLGLDDGGIDMLSLLIQGTRISLTVGGAATFIAVGIGGTVGVLSGYFGGVLEVVLMRITDVFLVLPDLALMIVVAAIWGPSLFHIIVVISLLLWTYTARIVRAEVKSAKERVYVRRARTLGAGHARVIVRHILPQVGPLVIANVVLTIAVAVFDETALSFLGLGDPTKVSWGVLIEHAFERSAVSLGAWWAIVPPGLCVGAVIACCYLLGQSLEELLNPRLGAAHLSSRMFALGRPALPKKDAA